MIPKPPSTLLDMHGFGAKSVTMLAGSTFVLSKRQGLLPRSGTLMDLTRLGHGQPWSIFVIDDCRVDL